MRLIFIIVGMICLAIAGYVLTDTILENPKKDDSETHGSKTTTPVSQTNEAIVVLAEELDTPWAIAFLPTGEMLVTERYGAVRLISSDGRLQEEPVAEIASVDEIGEGGLLGITIHPNFETNHYVYLYYTYSGSGNNTLNRVARYTFENNKLVNERVIMNGIPGASNHNGGRIIFGPDGNLYIGTGDAQEPSQAQNTNSLAGKILRITDEGKPASSNPFNNAVYSYGHRNVQGLAFDAEGRLWATEHGRSGAVSGMDEVNLIEPGKNYGWPEIEGDQSRSGMVRPVAHSGPTKTWAPAGAVIIGNSLFFGGLRGVALYEVVLEGNQATEIKEHFSGEYGRIREVTKGSDGMLYITTSNQDGRGRPSSLDDRVIRVNPQSLAE